jgi:hypothetical protein
MAHSDLLKVLACSFSMASNSSRVFVRVKSSSSPISQPQGVMLSVTFVFFLLSLTRVEMIPFLHFFLHFGHVSMLGCDPVFVRRAIEFVFLSACKHQKLVN